MPALREDEADDEEEEDDIPAPTAAAPADGVEEEVAVGVAAVLS